MDSTPLHSKKSGAAAAATAAADADAVFVPNTAAFREKWSKFDTEYRRSRERLEATIDNVAGRKIVNVSEALDAIQPLLVETQALLGEMYALVFSLCPHSLSKSKILTRCESVMAFIYKLQIHIRTVYEKNAERHALAFAPPHIAMSSSDVEAARASHARYIVSSAAAMKIALSRCASILEANEKYFEAEYEG